MTPRPIDLAELLQAERIVPVLTLTRLDDAVPLAHALMAGGLRTLEITLRTPVALAAAERIAAEVEGAIVGLGTVTTASDIAAARRIGAHFAVSPGATETLFDAARDHAMPFLPGVATASEIMAATSRGARVLKFFPAVPAGGLPAVKAFAGPFPDVRFCPTGGIGEADLPAWLAQPNVLAVGGSWLAPADRIAAGDWATITQVAARSVSAARGRG
jgi:2-dehydro-3-deoxyphosphogluconate aldolase/(4S)-4-hydroxy-2-oxoglutarate aldolase